MSAIGVKHGDTMYTFITMRYVLYIQTNKQTNTREIALTDCPPLTCYTL